MQHPVVAHTHYFSTHGTSLAFFSVLGPAAALSFGGLLDSTVAPFKKACMTPAAQTHRGQQSCTDRHEEQSYASQTPAGCSRPAEDDKLIRQSDHNNQQKQMTIV